MLERSGFSRQIRDGYADIAVRMEDSKIKDEVMGKDFDSMEDLPNYVQIDIKKEYNDSIYKREDAEFVTVKQEVDLIEQEKCTIAEEFDNDGKLLPVMEETEQLEIKSTKEEKVIEENEEQGVLEKKIHGNRRKNGDDEESMRRKREIWRCEYRKRRSAETEEQRRKRLERKRKKDKIRRKEETEEQRMNRLKRMRNWARNVRLNKMGKRPSSVEEEIEIKAESKEHKVIEKNEDLEVKVAVGVFEIKKMIYGNRRQIRDDEENVKRKREIWRCKYRKSKSAETEEQRRKRLERMRKRERIRREEETEEQRMNRLERMRNRERIRRKEETEEQRMNRLERMRNQARNVRLNKMGIND